MILQKALNFLLSKDLYVYLFYESLASYIFLLVSLKYVAPHYFRTGVF